MILTNFLKDINIHGEDKKYLCLLLFFGIALMIMMISFNQTRGAFNPDIYAYLAGTLELAGLNFNHLQGGVWIQNSPVIIFFTAILFRLGFVDISSIFIVTGIFSIFGIFGMYTLLKVRFSPLLSFTGAILYNSLSLTLYYFANGMLDVPAVSMILWTLIFTISAVNNNYKYYPLVSLLFCITFFTRFSTTYILAIIILFMFKKYDLINLIEILFFDRVVFKNRVISFFKSQEFKWIFYSIILAGIIFLLMFKILLGYSELTYFYMANSSINGFSNPVDVNRVNDHWFYLKNFLKLLSCNYISFDENFTEIFNGVSPFVYIIMSIFIGGIVLKSINFLKNFNYFKENFQHIKYRNNVSFLILLCLIIILMFISRYGMRYNYLISLVSLWIMCMIVMSLIRNFPINHKNFSLSIICFALFSFYLVAVSSIDLKCVRYLLPAIPGFIYFVIYSFNYILEFINCGFDDEKSLKLKLKYDNFDFFKYSKSKLRLTFSKVLPIILIVICLFVAFNFSNTVDINQDGLDRVEFCEFIQEYDDDYHNKTFLGFRELRIFEWYLNQDILKWGEDIVEFNPDDFYYVITEVKTMDDNNFKEVYHKGKYHFYERVY